MKMPLHRAILVGGPMGEGKLNLHSIINFVFGMSMIVVTEPL